MMMKVFSKEFSSGFLDLSMDASLDRSLTPELASGQQLAVVALVELAHLVKVVGSAVASLFVEASGIHSYTTSSYCRYFINHNVIGIMEPVFAVLLHPCLPCRMASAWCLRCVAASVPSLLTPLVDRCLNRCDFIYCNTVLPKKVLITQNCATDLNIKKLPPMPFLAMRCVWRHFCPLCTVAHWVYLTVKARYCIRKSYRKISKLLFGT